MKKIVSSMGTFGPFSKIEKLSDRYECDGIHYPFFAVGEGTIDDWVGPLPVYVPSDEETQQQAIDVRAMRNEKLKDSDWTQVADAPVDKQAWATYRQALRDITSQSGFPWEVTWPVAP